jgi:hypothetical protein
VPRESTWLQPADVSRGLLGPAPDNMEPDAG